MSQSEHTWNQFISTSPLCSVIFVIGIRSVAVRILYRAGIHLIRDGTLSWCEVIPLYQELYRGNIAFGNGFSFVSISNHEGLCPMLLFPMSIFLWQNDKSIVGSVVECSPARSGGPCVVSELFQNGRSSSITYRM